MGDEQTVHAEVARILRMSGEDFGWHSSASIVLNALGIDASWSVGELRRRLAIADKVERSEEVPSEVGCIRDDEGYVYRSAAAFLSHLRDGAQ